MSDEWLTQSTGDQVQPDIESGSPVPVTDPERLTSGAIGEYTQPTRWENFWTNTRLESMDAPVGGLVTDELGAWTRGVNLKVMEWEQEATLQKKISAEEANALFPELEVKFTEPVYKDIATVIAATQKRRSDMLQTMARGYQLGSVLKFAGTALAQGSDPTNLVAGTAVGGAFKMAGVTSTAFKVMVAEETIGNALTEFVTVPALQKEMRDYGIKDAAVNALAGGVFGAGLRKGFGALASKVKERLKAGKPTPPTPEPETPTQQIHESMPPEANRQAVALAAEQMELGKPVDVSHIVEHQRALESGAVSAKAVQSEGFVPYQFKPVADVVEIHAPMRDGIPVQSGEGKIADGYVVTDNPHVADNIAGSGEGLNTVTVTSLDTTKTKLLDLDSPVEASTLEKLSQITSELGDNVDSLVPGDYVNSALNYAIETGDLEPLLNMQEVLKNLGFAGYKYVAKSDMGEPLHNVFEFFDKPAELAAGQTRQVRREAIPEMSPEILKEAQERAMQPHETPTPKAVENVIKSVEIVRPQEISEELDSMIKKRDESLIAYEKQFKNGQLTEAVYMEIKQALSDAELDSKMYERIAEATGTCLTKGGG